MNWDQVRALELIWLNLGGGRDCHPAPWYKNYVSVDSQLRGKLWSVKHDLRTPFPLPENAVERILTEDALEHLTIQEIGLLIADCHRILKPGGLLRIGVPDYMNPKDRPYLERGTDVRFPGHTTLTHFQMMKELVQRSPFSRFEFYQYWDGETFLWKPIDYSLGLIKRTPENYYSMYMRGIRARMHLLVQTFRQPKARRDDRNNLCAEIKYGHPLFATEIVVDLHKKA
jgi:predicted SAM-dependent methyltransferase